MRLGAEICYRLALRRALRRSDGATGANPATFDETEYLAWRRSELEKQLDGFIEPHELEGLDILDFGCGHGDLALLLARRSVRSITGLDVSRDRVEVAKERAAGVRSGVRPEMVLAEDPSRIEFPDASFDAILCFDVLEHVMDYEAVIPEWSRVLRPGGTVFIWWVPWLNPWGPHIESLVPIPWAHVVFSDRALIETCARIYEHPDFKPRIWDLDPEGTKKPNKWRRMQRLPEVNRLTIRRFERLATAAGLVIRSRDVHGFGGSALARATRLLTRIPGLGELFTACVTYRLSRHDRIADRR